LAVRLRLARNRVFFAQFPSREARDLPPLGKRHKGGEFVTLPRQANCPRLRAMNTPVERPNTAPRTDWLTRISGWYGTAFVARPWLFSVLALIVTGVVALGLARLEFSSDNRDFFGDDNADVARLQAMAERFAGAGTLTLMVRAKTGDMFTPSRLARLEEMRQAAADLPGVLRSDAITNHTHSSSNEGALDVGPLIADPSHIDPAQLDALREQALGAPELVNRAISADGRAAVVTLTLRQNLEDGITRDGILRSAAEFRDHWRGAWPDVEIFLSGALLADATFNMAAKRDLFGLVPIVAVGSAMLLALGVGSLTAVAGALAAAFAATLASLGFAGWVGIAITPGTAISPLASMVLITASCVHVIVHHGRARADGLDRTAAVNRALAENFGPVAVTTLTTAIGFLCMNFAESPPLRQMGNLVAAGLVVGWVATMTFLPFALLKLPAVSIRPLRPPDAWMERLASWVILRSKWLIALFACLVLVAVSGLARLGSNDIFHRYFDTSFDYRLATDAMEESIGGVDALLFPITAANAQTVFDPPVMAQISDFADWLRAQPGVTSIAAISDVLAALQHAMDPDGPNLPDSAEASAQLMLLYELSLPDGQSMDALLDVDRRQTRVTAAVRFQRSSDLEALAADAEGWMLEHTPLIAAPAAGVALAFAAQTRRNNLAMVTGMFTVLLLVSAIMVVALRSFRFGVLSLIPNILPALLAFGAWGLVWRDVNLGSAIVTTMTFGIVVDDTVHLMMHFLRHRRAGRSAKQALQRTFRSVGIAVTITSAAIILGFAVLATSGFAINAHIGALTALVVGIALLTDVFLLAPLLVRFAKDRA